MNALIPSPVAAKELLTRREIRGNIHAWAPFVGEERGWMPADHHTLLLEVLQRVTDNTLLTESGKPCRNVMVLMPPGSAKSTYTSVVFPPWFLQRRPAARILACSHSADLIESFSRECRNIVESQSKVLGYNLAKDSKAVQEWSTTSNGTYRCSGVGAGLAGRRADLGYIDDYLGSEEDADSKLIRDKQWAWYLNDFWPRLKPEASQVIVANRRNEDDLVGRILAKEASRWLVIKISYFAKEEDPLNRVPQDRGVCLGHIDFSNTSVDALLSDERVCKYLDTRLWPEYFTREMAANILLLPPRTQAGLYGQEPAPEEGNYFKSDWLLGYSREDLESLLRNDGVQVFGAGDWAVSEEKDANRSCFGGCALAPNGDMLILPDIFWKSAGPREVLENFIAFLRRRKPLTFWSEKGHISKAWGPFLKEMMLEEQIYSFIQEVTPAKAKDVRARAIQGRMSMGKVLFPMFAHWWPEARHELLTFPGGKTDDFVDFIAHLGMGVNSMTRARVPKPGVVEDLATMQPLTLAWIKKSHQDRINARLAKYGDR